MAKLGGAASHRRKVGYVGAVDPRFFRAIPRESMTLTQIYKAGEGAGHESTGVFAVWMEGRGQRVIDQDGRYTGLHAVTTPWPLRVGAPLETEALPHAVLDAFKAARGGADLEQALAQVHALGRAAVT